MQGSDLIFCLQDADYNFWKIDATGNVLKSATPYFFDFSPAGWEELGIQNKRNSKYWAVDRTVTLPLAYVGDGATIIKYVALNIGSEEILFLSISGQQLDFTPGVEYGFWYKQIYRGQVDLSTYLHNGAKVTCNSLEDGLAKYLKSNENTVYEFPMNVPEAIFIKMDGINLHNQVETVITNGANATDPNYDRNNHTVAIDIVQEDAPYVGGKKSVGRVKYGFNNADLFSSQAWFLAPTVNGVLNFTYDFSILLSFPYSSISLNPATNYRVHVLQLNAAGAVVSEVVLFDSGTTDFNRFNNRTYHIVGAGTINIIPGCTVYLNAFANVSGPTGAASIQTTYLDNGQNFFKYSYLYRYPTTYIRAFRMQYLLEQLVKQFTDNKYTAAISAYLTLHADKVITSGNAIRGLNDATMKIDFSDFFTWLDSFDAVGIYEKNMQIFIDRKENMINRANPIILGEPAAGTFQDSFQKSLLFNELEIGYPKISNEVGLLNGNEECNDNVLFSLGTAVAPARLTKVSPIKASPYEIERIRVLAFTSSSTDYKSDNDNFVIHIEDVLQPADPAHLIPAHYKLDRTLNAGATGLLEAATIFNLELTPKRNLLRNGSFLRSCVYRDDSRVLGFKSADKNDKVVAGGVIEKADVTIGNLDPRFFYPILFDFIIQAPMNLEDLLEADPLSLFVFPFNGEMYAGTLQSVGVSPAKNAPQKFQLMADIICDPTKLIDYYG